MNTDTDQMFSASLPWRQRAMALDRAFPQSQGLLVAVIDAKSAKRQRRWRVISRMRSLRIARIQHGEPARLLPDLSKEALLFLSTSELTDPMDQLSMRTVPRHAVGRSDIARPVHRARAAGQGVTHGDANLAAYADELRAFHTALRRRSEAIRNPCRGNSC